MNANGGGLAVNITGKYESNRHAIACMEKYTFGDCAKHLRSKKGGAFDITAADLLRLYKNVYGEPEWHHAGFLPKSYGGGMKKTFFCDELISKKEFISILKKNSVLNVKILFNEICDNKKELFLKENAKRFERKATTPAYSVITNEEMDGKYGWFEAQSRYNLPVYYSGWSFESAEKMEEYFKI